MKVGLQTPSSQNQRDQRSWSIPRPDSPDERRTSTHTNTHTQNPFGQTRDLRKLRFQFTIQQLFVVVAL